ncbi:MAG: ATPase [Flavobacteriales bacterium]|nr:MAG: ATPase [Flavobacteriales bacterium]
MITRLLSKNIKEKLFKGKTIVLIGPRQVGKTTLLQNFIKDYEDVLWLNADEKDVRAIFDNPSATGFKKEFGSAKILVIDEAQRIKDIGVKLKLITDQIKDIQLIVTGSSAFELANEVKEPLTGRKWEYKMYPISFEEMVNHHGLLEEKRLLKHRLVYGYYPDIVTAEGDEKEILKQLSDSYLYKDLLTWNKIQKSDKIIKLLQALAFQVGNQVSYNELGQTTGLDSKTVETYIQLLEQAFIVFRLGTFNRNLRTELKKTRKIYFYDNGIRNALIANFQQVELRQDMGALWENFMIAERMKFNDYHSKWVNRFFWRTQAQQEVDYIEETDGQLFAYEFKWNVKGKGKITKAFTNAYPNAITQIITPANFEEFLLKKGMQEINTHIKNYCFNYIKEFSENNDSFKYGLSVFSNEHVESRELKDNHSYVNVSIGEKGVNPNSSKYVALASLTFKGKRINNKYYISQQLNPMLKKENKILGEFEMTSLTDTKVKEFLIDFLEPFKN